MLLAPAVPCLVTYLAISSVLFCGLFRFLNQRLLRVHSHRSLQGGISVLIAFISRLIRHLLSVYPSESRRGRLRVFFACYRPLSFTAHLFRKVKRFAFGRFLLVLRRQFRLVHRSRRVGARLLPFSSRANESVGLLLIQRFKFRDSATFRRDRVYPIYRVQVQDLNVFFRCPMYFCLS